MNAAGVLENRRIVITGAGGGLGAAYARAAAGEGASVVVNDIDESNAQSTVDAIRDHGGVAEAFVADVSEWEQAGALIDFCTTRFGGIDGLVNNAGILGRPGTLLDEDPHWVARVLNVNILGTAYPGMRAARAMVASHTGGVIVNVSSGNQTGAPSVLGSYGASKGAVSTLTYAWSEALAPHGIRVNAISPNAMTPMIINAVREFGENAEGERPMPTPDENASVVTYLLSDLSAGLTGQVVRVDHKMLSITSHPVVVAPQAPIEFGLDAVAEAFDGLLKDAIQPAGIALAHVEHLGPVR